MSHSVLGYAMVLVTATDDQGLIHTLNFIVQVLIEAIDLLN